VLKLNGFDQIPQFSSTSLKYHLHASYEYLREFLENFQWGSRSDGLGIRNRRTRGSSRNPNPLSHQWLEGNGGSGDDESSQNPGRRRFDLERQGVAAVKEEREPILPSDLDVEQEWGADHDAEEITPTAASMGRGIDPNGVIRL
jgi:hypothetical protein